MPSRSLTAPRSFCLHPRYRSVVWIETCQHRVVSFAGQPIPARACQKSLALLGRKPVPDTDSKPTHSFDSTDSGRQFRAEESGIGSLIGNPSDSSKAQVDGRWCVLLLLEIDAVPQHDGAIECQARL
jgi:hypothetical protein